MKIKIVLSLLLASVLTLSSGKATPLEDFYKDIVLAIKSGNAKELAVFFGSNIELTVLDKEDLYSKSQAELIIKDFFSKHSPKSFNLLHQGASEEGSKYAIGNYVAKSSKVFRTYLYLKKAGSKYQIQELRFEEEE